MYIMICGYVQVSNIEKLLEKKMNYFLLRKNLFLRKSVSLSHLEINLDSFRILLNQMHFNCLKFFL